MCEHPWILRAFRLGMLLGIGFSAAACASFSPDAGMGGVNEVVAPVLATPAIKLTTDGSVEAARKRTVQLLKSSLTADAVVRVALLANKGLQAAYNELGLAEAVMIEASIPPNPTFSLSRVSTPVELDIEGRIVADILALATLPMRAEIAAERFHQAQLNTAQRTLRIATEVRRHYYRAVAALQIVAALDRAASTAEIAEKLTRELSRTGAVNKLDEAREQAFHADLLIQLVTARNNAAAERERLIRAMGLADGDIRFVIPRALPALPVKPRTVVDIEIEALRHRLDLRIARIELNALAKSYGLTKATRFISLLNVSGVSRTQRDAGGTSGTGGGGEVEFQIPIFDFGEVRLRQAGETYMQALNRLTEAAVMAQSESREAYQRYRSSYEIAALYRTRVLPLRKTIADEMMLRYGAMQIDVFSLLTEAQRRIATDIAAIKARREFWLAATNLDAAVLGGGVISSDRAPLTGNDPIDMADNDQ